MLSEYPVPVSAAEENVIFKKTVQMCSMDVVNVDPDSFVKMLKDGKRNFFIETQNFEC